MDKRSYDFRAFKMWLLIFKYIGSSEQYGNSLGNVKGKKKADYILEIWRWGPPHFRECFKKFLNVFLWFTLLNLFYTNTYDVNFFNVENPKCWHCVNFRVELLNNQLSLASQHLLGNHAQVHDVHLSPSQYNYLTRGFYF